MALAPRILGLFGVLLLLACGGSGADGRHAPPDTAEWDATADATPKASDAREAELDAPRETSPQDRLVAMTFNLLCSLCVDESRFDPWDDRLAYFGDVFERHDPDVLGIQEIAFGEEVADVLAVAPGYEAVYFQGEGSTPDFPDATILFRAERFELVDEGSYWLSPTPEEPMSKGFHDDQVVPRLVVWVTLRQRADDRMLAVVNTHFDANDPTQPPSAELLLERTAPLADEMPVVVLGDFNTRPDEAGYEILVGGSGGEGFALTDAFDVAGSWRVVAGSKGDYDAPGRIDHVFLAGGPWAVEEWSVDLTRYGDGERYPSDHWPITAVLRWPGSR